MSEKVFEKCDNPRAQEQIRKDARDGTRQVVERVSKSLTDRGYKREDVFPFIQEGVRQGSYDQ